MPYLAAIGTVIALPAVGFVILNRCDTDARAVGGQRIQLCAAAGLILAAGAFLAYHLCGWAEQRHRGRTVRAFERDAEAQSLIVGGFLAERYAGADVLVIYDGTDRFADVKTEALRDGARGAVTFTETAVAGTRNGLQGAALTLACLEQMAAGRRYEVAVSYCGIPEELANAPPTESDKAKRFPRTRDRHDLPGLIAFMPGRARTTAELVRKGVLHGAVVPRPDRGLQTPDGADSEGLVALFHQRYLLLHKSNVDVIAAAVAGGK